MPNTHNTQRPEGILSDEECLKVMLAKYCEFLNLWLRDSGVKDYTYTPEVFTVDDPDRALYGSSTVVASYPTDYYWCVAATVYDGDDGGPSFLTGYFTIGAHYGPTFDDPSRLHYMIQEFDTMIQIILDEGELRATPEQEEE